MKLNISGILLAAGQSQRFGSQKLTHLLDDNVPMIVQSGRNLLSALPDSIAVVHDNKSSVATLLNDIGIQCITNPDAHTGMSSSIITGIRHRPDVDGWLICLGDMPFIAVETIASVLQELESGALIVAPQHNGQQGHPVGFSARLKKQLLALIGDRGAKSVIKEFERNLVLLEVDDPGVLRDIDCVDDLAP